MAVYPLLSQRWSCGKLPARTPVSPLPVQRRWPAPLSGEILPIVEGRSRQRHPSALPSRSFRQNEHTALDLAGVEF